MVCESELCNIKNLSFLQVLQKRLSVMFSENVSYMPEEASRRRHSVYLNCCSLLCHLCRRSCSGISLCLLHLESCHCLADLLENYKRECVRLSPFLTFPYLLLLIMMMSPVVITIIIVFNIYRHFP